ncbi:hypothetical protein [Pelosinus sp. IPA-1]|uniref:hypothetical protein n=1 Tax=Pelosinus sp. IPA-1 TaxID=3029569 RepID=UPI0024361B58|nr:hypothetical protein [Pelosinus sp. IPA-1]GMA98168.1 hypothetical protein PIPA1_09680 [Pelosinus sp. IPA-1]
MKIFISLLLTLLVLASSGSYVYVAIKGKETKMLCIQIGLLGLVIAGGIFSIYRVPDPSIAKILGIVIPRVN